MQVQLRKTPLRQPNESLCPECSRITVHGHRWEVARVCSAGSLGGQLSSPERA